MAKAKKAAGNSKKKSIDQYAHKRQAAGEQSAGRAGHAATDKESGKKTYDYDPHLVSRSRSSMTAASRVENFWTFPGES